MCIICAKPAGVMMPAQATREIMWKNNPDGAGLMWTEKGKVKIAKGFMSYNAFETFVENLASKIDLVKTPVVMHFRITTHGGTKAENCHPFPITEQLGILQKLNSSCEIGVAHNGILNIHPRDGISDTMEYVVTQLAIMKKINRRFYQEKRFLELISNATIGSRLCFLTGDGDIATTGEFIKEESGLLYSNSNYKNYKYTFNTYDWTSYSGYGNEKLLCCAADLRIGIRVNGTPIDEDDLDEWYTDKKDTVYRYDYKKDGFVKVKAARIDTRVGSKKWNLDDSICAVFYANDDICYLDETSDDGIPVHKCDICGTAIKADASNLGYEDEATMLCKSCAKTFGYTNDYENPYYYAW